MNAVNELESLANASIEQIEQMALKAENADEQQADTLDGEASDKQDVVTESSVQTDEGGKKESDKEINFAKLRTKTEALEGELQRVKAENERLAKSATYVAELPADHAQKVSEVDAQLASVGTKFQDGDLTWEEYQAQLRELNTSREQLVAAALKAEISREMREQAARQAEEAATKTWQQTVDSFISAKPDSIDYETDKVKHKDLNTYVKALAADLDNSDKNMEWFLTEAHTLVKAKHRIADTKPAQKVIPAEPAKPSAPFNTLSDVPGGLPPAKNDFENLEGVSGAALTNRFLNDPGKIDQVLASLG